MASKNILLINGHPNAESFNLAVAAAYKKAAPQNNAVLKEIINRDLQFYPNHAFGNQEVSELEPDLKEAQEKIKWADHLVWIHSFWWGGLPAMAKAFIDRILLPGFGFRYGENSVWWDKLLRGKIAQIITTLDTPSIYHWFAFGKPSVNQLRKSTLEFCGIKPVKVTYIGAIKIPPRILEIKYRKRLNDRE